MGFLSIAFQGIWGFFSSRPNSTIFIGIFVALFAVLILPNTGKILNAFGWKSSGQVEEALQAEKNVSKGLITENRNLAESMDKLEDSTNAAILAVSDFYKEKEAVQKKTALTVKTKETKIKKVVEEAQATQEESQVTDAKVSEIQISSIWDNYCSFNEADECQPTSA